MSINDLELADLTVKMSYLMTRLGAPITTESEMEHFLCAAELERYARAYQERLNRLRWPLRGVS